LRQEEERIKWRIKIYARMIILLLAQAVLLIITALGEKTPN
jgi:hypothetical protein